VEPQEGGEKSQPAIDAEKNLHKTENSQMNHREDGFFLPENASKARVREAENARQNRAEIVKAFSHGQVNRRDLIQMGLITTGGLLAPIHGLNPFVSSAYGSIPTGANPSPLFGAQPFTQAMGRFDVLPRIAPTALNPLAQAQSNQTQQPVDPLLGGGTGPIEGRPPGATWAHQSFTQFPPQVAYVATQEGAKTNTIYNPQVASNFNSGINPATPIPLKFHPLMPTQNVNSVWTFN
jgi:manganese oxidase